MAEEFQGGIYSASWWSSSRKGIERSVTAPNSCSVSIADISSAFNWTPEIMEGGRNDEVQRLEISDSMEIPPLMADYSQALLGRVDEGFIGLPPPDYVTHGFMGDVCFSDSFCSSANFPGSSQDTSQPSWIPFPHYLKASSPSQQMHLSDNNVFYPPIQSQFDQKSDPSKIKSIPELVREFSGDAKKSGGEPPVPFKKPRMETPSSLPTFKVRKEKLGDRITALQQLVSPFGKTDTASVLHEAIDYIKFLHEQVLTTPYLQNAPALQPPRNSEKQKGCDGTQRDLRSRGLCLVPISSTLAVASEPMADFWTPTFGAAYR